ncbi:MAG: RNA polymerase sigma factor, partial [Planctomycetota bacterium]
MMAGLGTIRSTIRVDSKSSAGDEARLIAQARSDPEAFIELYRRYYDAIFRYCVHRLFERALAEDATSQVFLKAVEHFGRFKGDAGQFRGWLYRIAGNVANEHLRKAARRQG